MARVPYFGTACHIACHNMACVPNAIWWHRFQNLWHVNSNSSFLSIPKSCASIFSKRSREIPRQSELKKNRRAATLVARVFWLRRLARTSAKIKLSPQHSAPQHSAPQHSATQHSATQHSAPQHSAPQHLSTQHSAPQHSTP